MGLLRDGALRVGSDILRPAIAPRLRRSGFSPRRILVMKVCCLGDVLMATPMLQQLKLAYPSASVSVLVGFWSSSMLRNNPFVDEILDCGSFGAGGRFRPTEAAQLARLLWKERFDTCFVLERSVVAGAVPWLAGIPARVGLDSRGRGMFANVRVRVPSVRHESELYLDTLRAIGFVPRSPRLLFCPSESDRAASGQVTRDLGIADAEANIVAVHPGGGVNPGTTMLTKRWPAEKYGELCAKLAREGYRVVVVGGDGDGELAAAVLQRSSEPSVVSAVGKLSLGETAALFERCRLVVGNDTGPIHLAAAVGARVIALFGPSDPRVYGPYGQADGVVSLGMSCSPCFHGGRPGKCPRSACLLDLPVDMVWAKVIERLAETRENG